MFSRIKNWIKEEYIKTINDQNYFTEAIRNEFNRFKNDRSFKNFNDKK